MLATTSEPTGTRGRGAAIGLLAGALLLASGCPPPAIWPGEHASTRIEVEDLGKDDDKVLVEAAKTIPGVRSVKVESKTRDHIVLLLDHEGSACRIPARLEKAITTPGLRPRHAEITFGYAAFDNKPPDILWVYPHVDTTEPEVVTEPEIDAVVEVPDHDVEEVKVAGRRADPIRGSVYRVSLSLKEGENTIVATARDDDGNESRSEVVIVLDTTPPAVDARILIVVEGRVEPGSTVLIDGREVTVAPDGSYRAEVKVRKGQKEVEIVAIDPSGNRTTTTKPILE